MLNFIKRKILFAVIGLAIYSVAHANMSIFKELYKQFDPQKSHKEKSVKKNHDSAPAETNLATAFSACKDRFPYQSPPVVDKNLTGPTKELCFDDFAVLYSSKTKTPVYSIEKLNPAILEAAKGEQRTNKFYEEARLPHADRSTLSDYKGTGYDRGHNAPAGDRASEEAMAQSFSLANMVPQVAEHNRGIWSKIEGDTRKYINRANTDIYVFTGPYFENKNNPKTIGSNHVWVPDFMWKVVYNPSNNKVLIHWSRNIESPLPGEKIDNIISYEEFSNKTGLHLIKVN
jgi:endonuclease G